MLLELTNFTGNGLQDEVIHHFPSYFFISRRNRYLVNKCHISHFVIDILKNVIFYYDLFNISILMLHILYEI